MPGNELPPAATEQVPYSSQPIVEVVRDTSIPGLKQEFVETLKTVTEISELHNISTSVTKLLVNTLNNQIQKNKLIDMFSSVQNIVDVKLVYDQIRVLCRTPGTPQVKDKQTCYTEFKCVIKEIERKVFCGLDVYGIAKDTAGLPETLILRILNDSVESLNRQDPDIEYLRSIMYELIEALHLQGDVTTTSHSSSSAGRSVVAAPPPPNINPERVFRSDIQDMKKLLEEQFLKLC